MTAPTVVTLRRRAARRLLGLQYRNELALLILLLVATRAFSKPAPLGVYGLGIVSGTLLVLNVFGVVLVYRSCRFINFAQVAVGVTAATFFSIFVRANPLLRLVDNGCPSCLDPERPSATLRNVNYVLSLSLGLALSVLLAWLIYHLVIKRFRDSAPMMLTVATIFAATVVTSLVTIFAGRLITTEQSAAGFQVSAPAPLPFQLSFKIGVVTFTEADVLTVAVALLAVVALTLYLRFSETGTVIRAAAENPGRAETLGIPVSRVTSRVWLIAGLLSGLAAHLSTLTGAPGGAVSESLLLPILVVAVVARFTSLPVAFVAAMTLGVLRQTVLWSYGSLVPLDASLFLILGLVLLLQRRRQGREEREGASIESAREIRPIPVELRQLAPVRKWLKVGLVAAVVIVASAPWVLSPAQTSLVPVYMIYSVIGLSLLVLTGWAGQISLGQFAFAAVGAYAAAVLQLPFLLALLVGGLAGMVVAVLVGIPALKLRGLHMAVMSLAFALAVSAVLLSQEYLGSHLPETLGRPRLLGVNFNDQRAFYYLTAALVAVVFVSVAGLRRSRTARALIAARDNEAAAQSFGINLMRARLSAFAVSGFLAGFAGALLAFQQNGVEPASFTPAEGVRIFSLAVVGGLGAVWGPLLGALYYGLPAIGALPAIVATLTGGIGALFLLQYLGSGGLAKLVISARDTLLRRLAKRQRIVVPSLVADVRESDVDDRVALLANERGDGTSRFVPRRYRLEEQWIVGMKRKLLKPGEVSVVTREPVPAGSPSSERGAADA